MNTCTQCGGDGLVGAGDNPAAKQGPISTCGACNGTGKVVENIALPVPEEAQIQDTTPGESAPVDNPDAPNLSDGSSDGSDPETVTPAE